MPVVWFCLVAFLISGYVVFDGYDLGAGAIHLFAARSDAERRQVLQSIGPLWDGNEVWLIASGGTLFFAFPVLYAASFSGFYLSLMMVLWLLVFRGVAIEFRSHFANAVWRPFWDAVFSLASSLLSLVFGVALGNVIRGVPLDSSGRFFLALWTDFGVAPPVGILDWYTLSTGALSFFALMLHGSLWINFRTEGAVRRRSQAAARFALAATAVMTAAVTLLTWRVQPHVAANLKTYPWGYVFPAVALAGLLSIPFLLRAASSLAPFLASSAYLVGMLAGAAFGIFPYVLPANTGPGLGLTVYNSIAGRHGLQVGLAWWIPGMLLALLYVAYVHVKFSGKVQPGGEGY
jgi:cytochrome d ubiquinol oxidase subunit II